MLIRIGQFDITECRDGGLYKKLFRFPQITACKAIVIYCFFWLEFMLKPDHTDDFYNSRRKRLRFGGQ